MQRLHYLILRELTTGEKTYWELLKKVYAQASMVIASLKELERDGFIKSSASGFCLTDKAKALFPIRNTYYSSPLCKYCNGKGYLIENYLEFLEQFKNITSNRPKAIPDFDQGPITPEGTILRVLVLYERGDLEGREILFLGDDDLTSIAAALTGYPKRMVVLEADERIVNFINENVEKIGLNSLQAMVYDVRNPLPQELRRSFDTFLTDPVETLRGFNLFLSRCALSLKGEGSAGYFGLSHLEASYRKWHEIQGNLNRMNFVITNIWGSFHEYMLDPREIMERGYRIVTHAEWDINSPDMNWYTTSLFRIELISDPKPLYADQVNWGRELYYDEEAYVTLS